MPTPNPYLRALLLGALCLPVSVTAQTLAAVVDSAFAAGFSGSILAADSTGAIVLERHGGIADRRDGSPIGPASRWRFASVTKQMTAVLVMQQVERGHLSLNTAIDEVLPSLRTADRAAPTVRHLLQHTSGLADPEETPRDMQGVPAFYRDIAVATRAPGAVPDVCGQRSARAPGASFVYNNCDYIVLAAMLEQLTGRGYAELLQELAREIGADGLTLADPEDWTGHRGPPGHVIGYLPDGRVEMELRLASYGAAGAAMGSMRDLLAFDRALLVGRLLDDATRRELWTGVPRLGYAALGSWVFDAPLRGCAGPQRIVERRGGIGAVELRNILLPESGHTLIVFTNQSQVPFGEIWMGRGFSFDLLSALAS